MNEDNAVPTKVLTEQAVMDLLRKCVVAPTERNVFLMFNMNYAIEAYPHREEVMALLDELPKEFHSSTGAGHSLAGAVFDKSGDKWSSNYAIALHLMALGKSIGAVREVLPNLRHLLPAGLPYYIIEQ